MMQDTSGRDIKSEIVELIGRGPRKARFVTEVANQLARANVSSDVLEHELQELEGDGRALVREQYCGDPHLVDADLRIVALVQSVPAGAVGQEDPLARAVADIDAVWGRWLVDYLSNHRCS